jgi:hypothetical protein
MSEELLRLFNLLFDHFGILWRSFFNLSFLSDFRVSRSSWFMALYSIVLEDFMTGKVELAERRSFKSSLIVRETEETE